MMNDGDLIRALGGPRALAIALGVERTRVYQWRKRGISAAMRWRVYTLAQQRGLQLDAEQFVPPPVKEAA